MSDVVSEIEGEKRKNIEEIINDDGFCAIIHTNDDIKGERTKETGIEKDTVNEDRSQFYFKSFKGVPSDLLGDKRANPNCSKMSYIHKEVVHSHNKLLTIGDQTCHFFIPVNILDYHPEMKDWANVQVSYTSMSKNMLWATFPTFEHRIFWASDVSGVREHIRNGDMFIVTKSTLQLIKGSFMKDKESKDRPDVALEILNTNSIEHIQAPKVDLKSEIKDEPDELFDIELDPLTEHTLTNCLDVVIKEEDRKNHEIKVEQYYNSSSPPGKHLKSKQMLALCPDCNEHFNVVDTKDEISLICHINQCSYSKKPKQQNSSQQISLSNRTCPHCNGQFKIHNKKDERSFSLHTEQCSKSPTTKPCPHCNEIFKTGDIKDNISFIQHKIQCYTEKNPPIRKQRTSSQSNSSQRNTSQSQTKSPIKLTCDCKINWETVAEKAFHMKFIHMGHLGCESCAKTFSQECHLKSHTELNHREQEECKDIPAQVKVSIEVGETFISKKEIQNQVVMFSDSNFSPLSCQSSNNRLISYKCPFGLLKKSTSTGARQITHRYVGCPVGINFNKHVDGIFVVGKAVLDHKEHEIGEEAYEKVRKKRLTKDQEDAVTAFLETKPAMPQVRQFINDLTGKMFPRQTVYHFVKNIRKKKQ